MKLIIQKSTLVRVVTLLNASIDLANAVTSKSVDNIDPDYIANNPENNSVEGILVSKMSEDELSLELDVKCINKLLDMYVPVHTATTSALIGVAVVCKAFDKNARTLISKRHAELRNSGSYSIDNELTKFAKEDMFYYN